MAGQKIVIEDLLNPVLTDVQRRMLEAAERNPVEMTEEAVLTAASKRTHLDDFGPDDFRERLRLWLDESDSDPDATEFNKATVFGVCVRQAANRLLVMDLLRRHPEIHEERIERPIVVGGLPRSGTTHMVALIAADTRLQHLSYWEALEPLPLPGESPGPSGVDPRWQRSQAGWEALQAMNPYMIYHHPMEPDHITEDGDLQMIDFSSYVMEFTYRAPRWRDFYLSHDQTPHYEFENTMLKISQWVSGERKRWVVKSPQHLEQLRPIMNVWPDATVVMTHRDPVGALESTVTMTTYRDRMRLKRQDPARNMAYWNERVGVLLERYLRDRDVVPDGQLVDVLFHEFVGDNMATIERIYAAADLPLTAEARSELGTYAEENQRHQHGAIDHDVRRDFGVEPSELRRRYAAYVATMPVALEVT